MSFFRELRRRNVYRVGAAYVIVGWLIIQIAVNIFPNLQLPPWTVTLVTVLVALGFPVALLLAWAFELTPDGVRPSRSSEASAPAGPARAVDYALLGGLALVAGTLLVTSFRGPAGEADVSGAADTVLVAIRPFADNSPDGDYAWLGQGFASELRNALGRIDGLEVAPPSFEFSFENSEAVAIVDFAVEGDIRVDGDTLRVSASLTNVAERNSRPLLQENYGLSSAFTIQEELAARLLPLLGVRLGVQDVNAFAGAGTTNMEAYENYLRAMSGFGPDSFGFLEEAVRIDPDYANAWAQLGLRLTALKWFAERPSQMLPFTAQGLTHVQRAHELQPDSAEVLAMLGTMYYGANDWSQGYEYHLNALRMRRTPIALSQGAALLYRSGKSTDAFARVVEAEEASAMRSLITGAAARAVMLLQLRRYDDARELLSEMNPGDRLDTELMLNLSAGSAEDVRQSIAALASGSGAGPQNTGAANRLYTPLLAVFDDPGAALGLLHEVHEDESSWPSKWHDIGRLAAWFGDTEFAFELVAEEARNGSPRRYGLWMPYMAEVRKLPEFASLVEEINLVEFWERYGWGDFCRPQASGFVCDN